MKAVVVGGGRMGLPLACVLADNDAATTVCDVDEELVDAVNAGRSPFEEPGLSELLYKVHAAGRLNACTATARAVEGADAVVVIVPAHLTPDREIDYTSLLAASAEVGKGLTPGTLVCYETTVSVGGTRRHLVPVLEHYSGLKAGAGFHVAYSPERVKANLVLTRLRETAKVVGGFDDTSRAKAVAFYSRYLGAPVDDVGTLEAAELTKLVGMLYRDVNIALVNELAEFSEAAGVDFELVRRVANKDGEASLLVPGIGVGGHCTPVYPYFLTRESRRLGVAQRLAEAARSINDAQPRRHVMRLARAWQPLAGKHVHVLGLGFRPGVKVDTFSPAYELRDELHDQDAIVTIEDPYYSDDEMERGGFSPGRIGRDPIDAIILNTAHGAFAHPDFGHWRDCGVEAVVDGRGLWSSADVALAGILYLGIGRPACGGGASCPVAEAGVGG
jgi:nucleotide sugar dehydrogenase